MTIRATIAAVLAMAALGYGAAFVDVVYGQLGEAAALGLASFVFLIVSSHVIEAGMEVRQ